MLTTMGNAIGINIFIQRDYIPNPSVLWAITPDNNEDIKIFNNKDGYTIELKNIKLNSISSLVLDILNAIDLAKKVWVEDL